MHSSTVTLLTTGFRPAGGPLRKCVECSSDCHTEGCERAVGVPVVLARPSGRGRGVGSRWVAGGVWELSKVAEVNPAGLRGHGAVHGQPLFQSYYPHSTDEEAQCQTAHH